MSLFVVAVLLSPLPSCLCLFFDFAVVIIIVIHCCHYGVRKGISGVFRISRRCQIFAGHLCLHKGGQTKFFPMMNFCFCQMKNL